MVVLSNTDCANTEKKRPPALGFAEMIDDTTRCWEGLVRRGWGC
jgi:hypothetical protein